MNILAISSYFGPETSVGVLRINAFVKYWTKRGHTVHVVTMPYVGELPATLHENQNLVVHQVAPLLIAGSQRSGFQAYSKGAKGARKAIVDCQYWLKKKICANYLDPRLLWWPRAASFICMHLTRLVKFDFMISSVPSYTAHSAAAVVKSLNKNILWVADYRDLWSGNPIFPGCALVRAFERLHEKVALKNADLLVSINQPMISELSDLHGPDRRYLTVPNGVDDDEADMLLRMKRERLSETVNILYAGSILPGLQDPTPLLQALKELAVQGKIKPGDLLLTFYGDYSAIRNYPLADDPLIQEYIRLCGKVSRQEMLQAEVNADFLLFLGSQPVDKNVGSTIGVVSGKIFEYLVSGTEIMAVGVTDDMIVAEMLRKSSTGSHYAFDVAKLKQRILAALSSGVPKVTPNMEYINQFRRSAQADMLIKEVSNLLY